MGHPDSPSTRWRFRKSTTATSDGDTLLPTTFLSSNNNGSAAPHLHNHEGSSERRRWRSKHYQDNYPKLFVQRNGVTTLHSNAMKILVAVGACLLFGVHLYLFRLLTRLIVTDANSTPPFLESSDSKQPLLLTPLRPIDREQYTIRINTWQRLDQLLVSIDHHASCPGVAQIQVVWCEPIDIPQQLLDLHPDKVVVERHRVNSLNERFHILPTSQTPTLGILSMDDDVLRSCEAIDAGFFQWTQSPHRMVGFDFRTHVENDDGSWKVSSNDVVKYVVFALFLHFSYSLYLVDYLHIQLTDCTTTTIYPEITINHATTTTIDSRININSLYAHGRSMDT